MCWAHTCTQTHDRLPCWTCLSYCNHFVQSHWKRKNKNRLVSERFFNWFRLLHSTKRGPANVLRYDKHIFFFSCEHKQRKVYKYTRKFCRPISRRFLQVFFLESVAEYARYRSPRVIWKRSRQFKAIIMFFFSLKSSRYPYFTSSKKILVGIQNIHIMTLAQQSVNEFREKQIKSPLN